MLMFAANEYADYVFRYGGRIEGTMKVTYQAEGCLEITHRDAHKIFHTGGSISSEDFSCSRPSVDSFEHLKILRSATDEEIDLYQKERMHQIELAEKIEKIRKANEDADENKKTTSLMIGTLLDDVDEEASGRNKRRPAFDSFFTPVCFEGSRL